jgi:hypothetical protein
VLFLTGLVLYAFVRDERYIYLAAFGFAMMVPISVMFTPAKYNAFMIYTIAMAVIGLAALGAAFTNNPVFETLALVFLGGFIAFQWIANFLMIRRSNR